jgi:hypothetical protein
VETGAQHLPRSAQVLVGVAVGAVAVGWAMSGVACALALALVLAWHAWSLGITAYLVTQSACALLGAPLMVRLALYLQRPHAHRPLGPLPSRCLVTAFALAVIVTAGVAVAAELV